MLAPPLEAKKVSFSWAQKVGYEAGKTEKIIKIKFIAIRKALFFRDSERRVHVELPKEDTSPAGGKLEESFYGTTDAAQNWTNAYF